MKKMIKKLAAAASLLFVVATGSAFAEYAGDLQFRLGYTGNTLEVKNSDDETTSEFGFGLSNYNLFKINDVFSVGFMEDFSLGIGVSDNDMNIMGEKIQPISVSVDFLIGPAVGIQLKNVVRFQLAFGLDYLYDYQWESLEISAGSYSDTYDISTSVGAWGWGFDLQANFLPEAGFSPIVGIRYSSVSPDEREYDYGSLASGTTKIEDATLSSFKFYVGGSINF